MKKRNRQYKQSLLRKATETNQLKWFIIGGIVLTGVAVVGIVYAKNKITKALEEKRKSQVEKNTLTEGSLENIAKKISIELEKSWYEFTDETAVIEAIRQIKSAEDYQKLIAVYKKLTGKVLNEEISKKFKGSELKILEDLIYLKPAKQGGSTAQAERQKAEEFADRIFKAVDGADFLGRAGDKALEIFYSLPNLATYELMVKIYQEKYGRDMWEDLEGEWDVSYSIALSTGKNTLTTLQDIVKQLR